MRIMHVSATADRDLACLSSQSRTELSVAAEEGLQRRSGRGFGLMLAIMPPVVHVHTSTADTQRATVTCVAKQLSNPLGVTCMKL